MELEGPIRSETISRFEESRIYPVLLHRSGFFHLVKTRYGFERVDVSGDSDSAPVTYRAGSVEANGHQTLIDQLIIEPTGLTVETRGDARVEEAVISDVLTTLDAEKVQQPVSHLPRRVSHVTNLRARLSVRPENLVSPAFLKVMKKRAEALENDQVTTELHANLMSVTILTKPRAPHAADATALEIMRSLGQLEARAIRLQITHLADYYDAVFTVRADLDPSQTMAFLEDFEKQLGRRK